MTSVSLNISLQLVHLTTTPLIHIYFYRIEIDEQGQCSGTFTLGFLVGALLRAAPELSPALRRCYASPFIIALSRTAR